MDRASRAAALAVLLVAPYASFTHGIQGYYHDLPGEHYIAFFNLQYVVCHSLKRCDVPTAPTNR